MGTAIVSGLELLLTFLATQCEVVIFQRLSQFANRFTVPDFTDRVLGVNAQHLLPGETTRSDNASLGEVQVDGGRWTRRGTGWGIPDAIEFFDNFGGKHKIYSISMNALGAFRPMFIGG